jgi:hypothetical protein
MLEERDDLTVLVTTGTVTSAGVMAERLPEGAIHQYIPLDARAFVTRFLDHWRPDLAVWCESELWPALICETHKRGIPMMIVNARMSKSSHDRWRFLRGMARSLLEPVRPRRWCRTTSPRCIFAGSDARVPDGGDGNAEGRGGRAALRRRGTPRDRRASGRDGRYGSPRRPMRARSGSSSTRTTWRSR